MTGAHRIIVQSKRVKYDFIVRRNITIITGDSGIGKTTLISMIRDYRKFKGDSNINLSCDKECLVVEGEDWQDQVSRVSDCIIFIDEGNKFISSKDFASYVKHSDNYFVLITRYPLKTLPYSVNEIYSVKQSGKYKGTKQIYNEMYHLYGDYLQIKSGVKPGIIITEDTNSGHDFFSFVSGTQECIAAKGKSDIVKFVQQDSKELTLIIADGAAFGCEIEAVIQNMRYYSGYVLYLPESFEWLILKSGLFKSTELEEILQKPCDYIDSQKFFSWERYFTHILEKTTRDTKWAYRKESLNPTYKSELAVKRILNVMEKIEIKD